LTLSLRHEVLELALRDPFVIARSEPGAGTRITTVVVEVSDSRFPGVVGLGEGYPSQYYGETPGTMVAVWPVLLDAVGIFEPTPAGLLGVGERMADAIRWNGAAKCALDIAVHDLVGKVTGQPVFQLLGLSAEIPPTDFTLGLDEPAVVAERARRRDPVRAGWDE